MLRVIISSPGELQPVFDTVLEKATRICGASFGVLQLCEGDAFRTVAMHNAPPAFIQRKRHDPMVRNLPRNDPLEQARTTLRVVEVVDCQEDEAFRDGTPGGAFARLTGAGGMLTVPMLKDNRVSGIIAIYRLKVRPFTDKQIALVENFATQAVMAIESARLLNELRQRTDDLSESLQQQTATSEVLGVISSSPGELGPVYRSLLENAVQSARRNSLRCISATARPFAWPRSTPPQLAGLGSIDNSLILFSRGRRDEFHREKCNHYKGILASSVPKLSQLRPVIVRRSTLFRARLGA